MLPNIMQVVFTCVKDHRWWFIFALDNFLNEWVVMHYRKMCLNVVCVAFSASLTLSLVSIACFSFRFVVGILHILNHASLPLNHLRPNLCIFVLVLYTV